MTAQLAYSLRALFSAKRGTAVILGNCIVGRWQPRSTSLRSYKINHKNTPVTDRGYTDDISEVTTADCKEYRIYPKIFQTLIKHFYLKIKLITLLKCLINNPNLGVIFASLTMLHCDDYCHCDEKNFIKRQCVHLRSHILQFFYLNNISKACEALRGFSTIAEFLV